MDLHQVESCLEKGLEVPALCMPVGKIQCMSESLTIGGVPVYIKAQC